MATSVYLAACAIIATAYGDSDYARPRGRICGETEKYCAINITFQCECPAGKECRALLKPEKEEPDSTCEDVIPVKPFCKPDDPDEPCGVTVSPNPPSDYVYIVPTNICQCRGGERACGDSYHPHAKPFFFSCPE